MIAVDVHSIAINTNQPFSLLDVYYVHTKPRLGSKKNKKNLFAFVASQKTEITAHLPNLFISALKQALLEIKNIYKTDS